MEKAFIVIVKLQKELAPDMRVKGIPDEWPAECVEVYTLEEAEALYPGKPVFKIPDYLHYKAGLDMGHALLPPPKKGFINSLKFWK